MRLPAQNYTENDEHSPIPRTYTVIKVFDMYDVRILCLEHLR
jgi:hypothetical protein